MSSNRVFNGEDGLAEHMFPQSTPPAYSAVNSRSAKNTRQRESSSLLEGTSVAYGSRNISHDIEAIRVGLDKSRKYRTISILIIGLIIGHYVPLLLSSASWELEEMTRDRIRRSWKREESVHKSESITWNNEKLARDAERVRWDADEKRGRDGLTWSDLAPSSSCLKYGVKEYSAILSRVPLGFDSIAECQRKAIVIQGKELLPTRCDDTAFCGRVVGHWEVNEAMCKPWWGWRNDKGCDPNHRGKRRWEVKLDNLHPGDDWEIMCETTPIDIGGITFIGAESCGDWGRKGIWGVWFVPDAQCGTV